jgi:protein pelota
MGQFHAVEVELNQKIKLEKSCWDSIHLERIDDACNPAKKADLAVVVMQEGLANICLVTSALTITKSKIERQMPKKNQVRYRWWFIDDYCHCVIKCSALMYYVYIYS